MPTYRKKPVEIEARQLTRETFHDIAKWAEVQECWGLDAPIPSLHIQTLEGLMHAKLGDYVIRDVSGQVHPCDPDIFAATYEPATERWRPGRKVGRTIYTHQDDDPDGTLIGLMDTPELARRVCDAVNAQLAAGEHGQAEDEAPGGQAPPMRVDVNLIGNQESRETAARDRAAVLARLAQLDRTKDAR